MPAATSPLVEQRTAPAGKVLIYLADLTHTGQLVAANTHPMGIGLIAANLLHQLPELVEVELFKYPDDLNEALKRRIPRLIGFSNYSWSCSLGQEYAARIKQRFPKTVVVSGGPNYGTSPEEHLDYWTRYPYLDFYVMKEGEVAIVELVKTLAKFDFDVQAMKRAGVEVSSCHYFQDGKVMEPALTPRIKDLNQLPSPYLLGLMEKFFDGILIPMTYTTRGCPFKCSFCTEGTAYYDKVTKRVTLEEDLEYIAQRVGTVQDLIITDANFGMFKEDREKAQAIARTQARYNWPRHIHVSGGKNQKERLLEVAEIINGAMNVAASLQSTDKQVLDNVRRSNISLDELTHVGRRGNKIDANTYAELILGLPGDSLQAHTNSLRDAVNAGLSFLRLYQLIMLPETDMNTPQTREKFGLKTRWRVMPRCFGTYKFLDEEFVSIEAEEICVAQNSLTFEDYLQCREKDLTIEITHNVNMFRELFGLCRHYGVSWFDFLMRFHSRRREHGSGLKQLYDTFREDTIKPLWDSREELVTFAKANLNRYILDELGTNELFKAKAVAFFRLQDELHDALYAEMQGVLEESGNLDATMISYLAQVKEFSQYRKRDLLDTASSYQGSYGFDMPALLAEDFDCDPRDYALDRPQQILFHHNSDQQSAMQAYIKQYGTAVVGLGRILMRAHVKRLFRNVETDQQSIDKGLEHSYRRALNLYGD
jgi:radical SAM superfamily enzyme YgiQ (UPF0313 family)